MVDLRESGHPLFRGRSALSCESFYKGDPATAELLFRIIISVSQLNTKGSSIGLV